MRSSTILSVLLLAACSGSGVSTTARTTTNAIAESGDGDDGDAEASDAGDDSNDTTPPDDDGSDTAMPSDTSGDPTDATADPSSPTDGEDTNAGPVTLQGSWLSEGDNIAPLLADLTGAVSITATFGDNAFTVVTVDDQGQEVQQVGVFTATPSSNGEIYEIVLEQTMPAAITVEGIYEVDNSVDPPILRYEVVQTEPSVGAIPPTAEGGFGSTSFGDDLTQIYVRQ